ncbi:MAG TPA: hypothetical protein DCK76_02225 [Desulfotomaculum sp.]|nr:MAG: hypothetical protein XD84_1543 [Desulfotomaculum sp. 46_80]HAG10215.1 hypothetical protein [Desulfotomaculum sp.]HBY04263.1 hypothetical protein [Desulfotomaculum sp.]
MKVKRVRQDNIEDLAEEERMRTLKEDLKNELLDMRAGEREIEHMPAIPDQRTRESLKREIIEELRHCEEHENKYGRGWGKLPGNDRQEWEQLKREHVSEIKGSINSGRLDAYDRQLLDVMRDEIRAEMRANPNNFHAREKTQDIMEEIQEMGYAPGEILRAVQQLQKRGTIRCRFYELMNSREGRGFKCGLSTAILALLFLPSVAKSLKPVTKWALKETMEVSERVQGIISNLKEDVEDILAEAQFERSKNIIDDEIRNEGESVPSVTDEK